MAMAVTVMAVSISFTLAQGTLKWAWERDRDYNHSDAGRMIQAYHESSSDANYVITAALLDNYTVMNVTKFDE